MKAFSDKLYNVLREVKRENVMSFGPFDVAHSADYRCDAYDVLREVRLTYTLAADVTVVTPNTAEDIDAAKRGAAQHLAHTIYGDVYNDLRKLYMTACQYPSNAPMRAAIVDLLDKYR